MVQYLIKILKNPIIILHCCCAQEMGGAVVYFSNIENFQQNGISGVAGMSFQKRNLLIGKNGAGKTRFLKSLVGTLKQQESTQYSVVLLDFSTFHLSSNTDSQGKETTKDDVYSILFGGDVIEFSHSEGGSPDWVDAECGYHGGRPGHGSAALVSSSCFAVRMVKGGAAAANQ